MRNNGVKRKYVVFQLTRDLDHLNWWQRILWTAYLRFARWCYARGLPTVVAPDGARIELQAVCSTEPIANAICATLPIGFVKDAPVDVSLPQSNVVFGGNRFPYSDAAAMYRSNGKQEIHVVCPVSGDTCRQYDTIKHKDLARVVEEVDKLRQIQSSVA